MAQRHHLRDGGSQHAVWTVPGRIADNRLEVTLWGEPVDVDRRAPAREPKGATYTALKVAKEFTVVRAASAIRSEPSC